MKRITSILIGSISILFISLMVGAVPNNNFLNFLDELRNMEDDRAKAPSILGFNSEPIFKQIQINHPLESATLSPKAFQYAFNAFLKLKQQNIIEGNQSIISICDFSLSSNTKRLWIIDVKESKVLVHSLVSHGKNTGEEYAVHFSNKPNSYQSSLGVYVTGNTYFGSNGYSLKLTGMDKGINDKAEERAIVLHGAAYCSEAFIEEHGRLGRSFGCPSVPLDITDIVINTIKDKSVFFIYQNDHPVLKNSQWIH